MAAARSSSLRPTDLRQGTEAAAVEERKERAQRSLWDFFDALAPLERSRYEYPRAPQIEPFYTLHEAAARLNLKYWQLLRMAKRGELELYRAGSERKRVRLSEVVEAIRRCSEPESRSTGRGSGLNVDRPS
jgi:excisionase family DNA binding protein